jgi:hypothetical protein
MTERLTDEERRLHLAWLIWCVNQGYVNADDRAILTNWLLDDPRDLHPKDAALRPHLLAMADEVLAAADDVARLEAENDDLRRRLADAEADADRLAKSLRVCTVAGPRPDIGRLIDERKEALRIHDAFVARRSVP